MSWAGTWIELRGFREPSPSSAGPSSVTLQKPSRSNISSIKRGRRDRASKRGKDRISKSAMPVGRPRLRRLPRSTCLPPAPGGTRCEARRAQDARARGGADGKVDFHRREPLFQFAVPHLAGSAHAELRQRRPLDGQHAAAVRRDLWIRLRPALFFFKCWRPRMWTPSRSPENFRRWMASSDFAIMLK